MGKRLMSNYEILEAVFPEKYVLSEAEANVIMPKNIDTDIGPDTENTDRNLKEFADMYDTETFILPGQGQLF